MSRCARDTINQSFIGTISRADLRVNYVVGNASKINTICCYVQPLTSINHRFQNANANVKHLSADIHTERMYLSRHMVATAFVQYDTDRMDIEGIVKTF